MRTELVKQKAVDALIYFAGNVMKDDAKEDLVKYTSLPTNEYLWALRAMVKLVGQEEESPISEDLERRGIRWLLHGMFNSLSGLGFPLEASKPATPAKYAQDIQCLAVSHVNAKLMIMLGAVEVLSRCAIGDWSEQTQIIMQSDPVAHAEAVRYATGALVQLCFSAEAQEKMLQNEELMSLLHELKGADAGQDVVAGRRSTPRAADAKKATMGGTGASIVAGAEQEYWSTAEQDPDYIAAVSEATKNAQRIVSQLAQRKAGTAWLYAAQRRAAAFNEGK